MTARIRGLTALAWLLAAAAWAAPPLPEDKKPAPTLDEVTPPGPAVFVVVKQLAEGLIPDAVVLTPAEFKRLTDLAARVMNAGREERGPPPSKCFLKARVDGGQLLVQAQFDFTTARPGAVVALACVQARATDFSLDDNRKPLLAYNSTDGFSVAVDKPGDHHLVLELGVELAARGNGRGFELDLPRAATTTLELDLPAGSKEVRVGGRPLADPLLEFANNQLKGPLGPTDKLDVSWKGAAAAGAAVLTAEGTIRVRLDERQGGMLTEADLLLRAQGSPTAVWRLLVPAGTDVRLADAGEGRLQGDVAVEDQKAGKGLSLRTIRLKEPADSVRVLATVTQPRPAPHAAVGPFALLGAVRQEGTVLIGGAAAGLRLSFHPRRGVAPREPTREEARDPALVAVFRYYWAASDKPGGGDEPAALLDVDAEAVRGLLETRVTQALRLRDEPTGRRWHVKTRIDAAPVRPGVEQLDVALPPGCVYAPDAGPADPGLVRGVETTQSPDGGTLLRFLLSGDPAKPFSLTFEATYAALMSDAGAVTLALPRPLGTRDKGDHALSATTPESLELLAAGGRPAPAGPDKHVQNWTSERLPETAALAWRPYRPDVGVVSEVDLTLTGREGQVRHRLRYQFPRTAPAQVSLDVPPVVADRLRVAEGGTVGPRQREPGPRRVDLSASAGRETTLLLEYSFAIPEDAASGKSPLTVPLVLPIGATHGETKVRIWADPGASPLPPGGLWTDLNVEPAGRERLPALVLRAQRPDPTLILPPLGTGGEGAAVLTERTLARVEVNESGVQSYRVSFRLSRLASPHLDVELPAPATGVGLRAWLDGREVEWEPLDESGRRSDAGRVARLKLAPDLVRRPAVLDVEYSLSRARSGGGPLQTVLTPPLLRDDPAAAPTRWLVTLPTAWAPLGPEGGPGSERSWSRRGWLLSPHPTATVADVERWFAGIDHTTADDGDKVYPTLTVWRDRLEPLTVSHAPQQAWLMACSLGVLGLGLGLAALARRGVSRGGWLPPAAGLAATATAVGALFWPTAVSAVAYGAEPGAAVLFVVAVWQWAAAERRRRRVDFLPSFTRARPTPPRDGSSRRAPGEPSTVDAPRPGSGWAVEAVRPEGGGSDVRESRGVATPG